MVTGMRAEWMQEREQLQEKLTEATAALQRERQGGDNQIDEIRK